MSRDDDFRPATGDALTQCYARRTTANWIDFLEVTDRWVLGTVERIYAILDNPRAHRATDVLFFSLATPAGSSSSSRRMPGT